MLIPVVAIASWAVLMGHLRRYMAVGIVGGRHTCRYAHPSGESCYSVVFCQRYQARNHAKCYLVSQLCLPDRCIVFILFRLP